MPVAIPPTAARSAAVRSSASSTRTRPTSHQSSGAGSRGTEWMFKAATIVSYGVRGGHSATEHLREVFGELHVVTTRRCVGLRAPWHDLTEPGYRPPAGTADAVDAALAELVWWTDVLRTARTERPFAA